MLTCATWCVSLAGDELHLINVILSGFPLPDPAAASAAAGSATRPAGLKAADDKGALRLQDVRVIVSAETLAQYVAHFGDAVAAGIAFTVSGLDGLQQRG